MLEGALAGVKGAHHVLGARRMVQVPGILGHVRRAPRHAEAVLREARRWEGEGEGGGRPGHDDSGVGVALVGGGGYVRQNGSVVGLPCSASILQRQVEIQLRMDCSRFEHAVHVLQCLRMREVI